ncbi:MAG TPA: preprotein translocase subunit YajC [Ruminococcaceae bacterium]|nr:preprotein translocase subunit YajC [Oscillospiraceae bacterium]
MASNLQMIAFVVIICVVMYFFMIRPQRKKEKEAKEMRSNLVVGDEITTIGGIVGRVVSLKDDSIVIETGANRDKIHIRKWAIQTVDTMIEEKAK